MEKFSKNIMRIVAPIVICVFMGLQGCTDAIQIGNDFLKKPPSQGVTIDTVFSKASLAKELLWDAYRSLPYGPGGSNYTQYDKNKIFYDMLASLTDINQSFLNTAGAVIEYYEPTGPPYSGSHTKYNYNDGGAWDGIRNAYIFIENVHRVPDMDQATKDRLKAEARMIIALHYTDMFRHFGGVPWVGHAFSPNEDLTLPRLTAKATVDSIVAVIERAEKDLPFTLNNPSTESGRFTQAAAMGLKARLLLFAASPLFNSNEPYMQGEAASKKLVWYGEYHPSMWQRAADAAKELIDKVEQTGAYHLKDTGNPRQDFQDAYYNRNSPEVLISTRIRYKSPNNPGGILRSGYYYGNVLKGGTGNTTHNYVQMFPMANGKPIDAPNSGYDPQHPYENRDPRLYETVLVNGDKYQDRTAELYIGGRERQTINDRTVASGYQMRKFILDGTSAFGTVVHFPYLRLPEIYLSYAEALNEINGGPTPEAYKYVNKVRNRVDLGDLPRDMNQKEFREAVLRERALELGYEEVRWYDLVRWKRKEDFTKTLYGMDICKKGVSPPNACEGSYGSDEFIYDRSVLPSRHWQDNWSPKWYLSAFPKNEINKEYGLIQNPGWE